MRDTIKVFKRYRYLLGNLISRDLKVKYRRSVLGVVWSVLNPLLTMVVIATVFAHLFRSRIKKVPRVWSATSCGPFSAKPPTAIGPIWKIHSS